MKRFLVVFLSALLLFSGTVFAAVNGEYKGNPIVYVNVDGQKYSGNVPAISLNGTTMVPVRFVSESLGADVKWDNNSYTVDISSNDTGTWKSADPVPTSSVSKDDIDRLKVYNKYSFYFNRLFMFSDNIMDLSDNLTLSFGGINMFNDMGAYNDGLKYLDSWIEQYNILVNDSAYYQAESTVISSILESQYNSIENYKSAYKAMYNFSLYKDQKSMDDYHKYDTKARQDAMNAGTMANRAYGKYYQLIQNY